MNSEKNIQEKLDVIRAFTLMDDIFFEAFAQDIPAVQEMLRIILKDPKLIILELTTQNAIPNLYGRAIRLDAVCKLEDERIVNIEIQNSDNDNHLNRVYFNSAQVIARESQKGIKFDELPHVIAIYIMKFDLFGLNQLIYHVDLTLREDGRKLDHVVDYIFINATKYDGTQLAKLMRCMQQKDINVPEFPEITRKFNQLKYDKEGVRIMCKIMEEYTAKSNAKSFANGEILGQIKVYHNELHLEPQEIAEKLNITEEKVREVISSF